MQIDGPTKPFFLEIFPSQNFLVHEELEEKRNFRPVILFPESFPFAVQRDGVGVQEETVGLFDIEMPCCVGTPSEFIRLLSILLNLSLVKLLCKNFPRLGVVILSHFIGVQPHSPIRVVLNFLKVFDNLFVKSLHLQPDGEEDVSVELGALFPSIVPEQCILPIAHFPKIVVLNESSIIPSLVPDR